MQRLPLTDRYQFSAQNGREQAPPHASEPQRAETPDSTSPAQGLGRLDWLARPGRDWWAAALPGPFSPSSLCQAAPQSRSTPLPTQRHREDAESTCASAWGRLCSSRPWEETPHAPGVAPPRDRDVRRGRRAIGQRQCGALWRGRGRLGARRWEAGLGPGAGPVLGSLACRRRALRSVVPLPVCL